MTLNDLITRLKLIDEDIPQQWLGENIRQGDLGMADPSYKRDLKKIIAALENAAPNVNFDVVMKLTEKPVTHDLERDLNDLYGTPLRRYEALARLASYTDWNDVYEIQTSLRRKVKDEESEIIREKIKKMIDPEWDWID